MGRRYKQLTGLAPSERWQLARLVLLLPLIGGALRWVGFGRVRDLLARLAPLPSDPQGTAPPWTPTEILQLARLVRIAARHGPYRASCLSRSLALWWLLRRRGLNPRLCIGVRKEGADLRAHAWVEHGGLPLETPGEAYLPFEDLD